jgi:hypothetical protein
MDVVIQLVAIEYLRPGPRQLRLAGLLAALLLDRDGDLRVS